MKKKSCHGVIIRMEKVVSPLEASKRTEYRASLVELLYQLADDDFLISFRGSEWLGLAPHIEEDVAFSSINQNTMGHAAIYYGLLEELGEGDADLLAHGRPSGERRNAVLSELVNGPGTYLEEPRFDWAFAVTRHFFYDVHKKLKLEMLKNSSYEPLAQAAVNINMEQYYHVMHWRVWFEQLSGGRGEAPERMQAAAAKVWPLLGDLLSFGPLSGEMAEAGLIIPEEKFRSLFEAECMVIFERISLPYPGPVTGSARGREGKHTEDLEAALLTLGEVYRSDPQAVW